VEIALGDGEVVDIEGMGREVMDCTGIAERHHGAQCAPPLRSKRGRGADEVPGWCGGALRVGEVESAGRGLETERIVVHVQGCEGNGVCLRVFHPRCGRLYGVEDM